MLWPKFATDRLCDTSYIKVPLLDITAILPSLKGDAGMIPILIIPGMMIPGVFGPTTIASFFFANSTIVSASFTGTCSGIATSSFIPDSNASIAAERKNFAARRRPVAPAHPAGRSRIGCALAWQPPVHLEVACTRHSRMTYAHLQPCGQCASHAGLKCSRHGTGLRSR